MFPPKALAACGRSAVQCDRLARPRAHESSQRRNTGRRSGCAPAMEESPRAVSGRAQRARPRSRSRHTYSADRPGLQLRFEPRCRMIRPSARVATRWTQTGRRDSGRYRRAPAHDPLLPRGPHRRHKARTRPSPAFSHLLRCCGSRGSRRPQRRALLAPAQPQLPSDSSAQSQAASHEKRRNANVSERKRPQNAGHAAQRAASELALWREVKVSCQERALPAQEARSAWIKWFFRPRQCNRVAGGADGGSGSRRVAGRASTACLFGQTSD